MNNLIDKINIALEAYCNGKDSMHVPPKDIDIDIVLSDCKEEILNLNKKIELLSKNKSNNAKLSSPARVGGCVFRKGVSENTVIECAKRLYLTTNEKTIVPNVSLGNLLKTQKDYSILAGKHGKLIGKVHFTEKKLKESQINIAKEKQKQIELLKDKQHEANREREQATEYFMDCEYLKQDIEKLKAKLAQYESSDSVLLPIVMNDAIKNALSYQCFDFIGVAKIYRDIGFNIPKKAENEQAFFLHRLLVLAIKYGDNFIEVFNSETKDMIEKSKLK